MVVRYAGVIFHSDKGSEYTASTFHEACTRLGITQSMGRVGSAYDNAAAESFNSTLEFELLSRRALPHKGGRGDVPWPSSSTGTTVSAGTTRAR